MQKKSNVYHLLSPKMESVRYLIQFQEQATDVLLETSSPIWLGLLPGQDSVPGVELFINSRVLFSISRGQDTSHSHQTSSMLTVITLKPWWDDRARLAGHVD
jgi:hypothetical protein